MAKRDPALHPWQPAPFTTLEIAYLVSLLNQTTNPANGLMYKAKQSASAKLNAALDGKKGGRAGGHM